MLCGHVLAVRLREHAFLQNTNSQTLPRLCAIILRNQNPSPPKSCAINAKKCNPLHHHLTTKHITKPHICRLELYSIQKLGVSMRFPSSPIVVHFQSLVSPKKKKPLLSLRDRILRGIHPCQSSQSRLSNSGTASDSAGMRSSRPPAALAASQAADDDGEE
jgi:hypothetical protein